VRNLASIPVVFEVLWFRNKATFLKSKTFIGSINDCLISSSSLIQVVPPILRARRYKTVPW